MSNLQTMLDDVITPQRGNEMAARKSSSTTRGRRKLTDDEKAQQAAALASETREERFKRLANPRVRRILAAIIGLRKCTRGRVEWTDSDVTRISAAIEEEWRRTLDAFQRKDKTTEITFTL